MPYLYPIYTLSIPYLNRVLSTAEPLSSSAFNLMTADNSKLLLKSVANDARHLYVTKLQASNFAITGGRNSTVFAQKTHFLTMRNLFNFELFTLIKV